MNKGAKAVQKRVLHDKLLVAFKNKDYFSVSVLIKRLEVLGYKVEFEFEGGTDVQTIQEEEVNRRALLYGSGYGYKLSL